MEGFRAVKDTEQPLCARCLRCLIICDDWWHFLYNFAATNPVSNPYVSYVRSRQRISECSETIKTIYKSARVTWDKILNMFDAFVGFVFHKVELEPKFGPLTRFSFRTYHTYGLGVKISTSGRSKTLKKSQTRQSYLGYDFGPVCNVYGVCRAPISPKSVGRCFLIIS